MSQTSNDDCSLAILNGGLVIEDSDNIDGAEWELCDTQLGLSIPIWPSEVPDMIAMLEAFGRRNNVVTSSDDHDCENWSVEHDVDGIQQTIFRCEVCNQLFA